MGMFENYMQGNKIFKVIIRLSHVSRKKYPEIFLLELKAKYNNQIVQIKNKLSVACKIDFQLVNNRTFQVRE